MKDFTKVLFFSACISFVAVCFTSSTQAQDRDRVVKSTGSQPTHIPPAQVPPTVEKPQSTQATRPILTNQIIVVKPDPEPLVKRTGSSKAVNAPSGMAAGKTVYGMSTSTRLDEAIKSRYGTPYRYGSTGPNTYDCSGFVWSAFQEAGINFTRESVRSLWGQSEPVEGDDRYKFGTLVFLNGLGHMGIVADDNGFYHASSSKGITYSPFKGYWENRIVGFRRLKAKALPRPRKKWFLWTTNN